MSYYDILSLLQNSGVRFPLCVEDTNPMTEISSFCEGQSLHYLTLEANMNGSLVLG